jgi:hypothetical protein
MKKRINLIAVALWVAAAIYLVAKLAALAFVGSFAASFAAGSMSGQANAPLLEAIGRGLDSLRNIDGITAAILGAGQLAALGTIIEILDRIRWQSSAQNTNGDYQNQPS